MIRVFIDGQEGTTGLRIADRLSARTDIELIGIPQELRKDAAARARCINSSDVTFLCLPDGAAEQSVALCDNPDTIIIDASTAHRTKSGWAYGFPELSAAHRLAIASSKRIAVPGCHAGGFSAIVYPLVSAGILPADYPITCHSLTGYTGGGKKMIAEYEDEHRGGEYDAPRQYALAQQHKHLPEMMHVCSLEYPPQFSPIVADFPCGMELTVPIAARFLSHSASVESIAKLYKQHYNSSAMISVSDGEFPALLAANSMAGCDSMKIYVSGSADNIIIIAVFDNLGKGASGAAIQCMNIACGLPETSGLTL